MWVFWPFTWPFTVSHLLKGTLLSADQAERKKHFKKDRPTRPQSQSTEGPILIDPQIDPPEEIRQDWLPGSGTRTDSEVWLSCGESHQRQMGIGQHLAYLRGSSRQTASL